MIDYEEVQAMVVIMEAKYAALLDRYERITQTPVLERATGDKVFMMNGGGFKECQSITSQLNALAWVLESN